MKIGLALSGGGARGICHLGVLKAFDEIGVEISHISGTSAGAITGALYGHGYSPDEIYDLIVKTKYLKLIRPAISKTGLLKMNTLESIFEKYLPANDFEALKVKLTVGATDLTAGKTVYFSEGNLAQPLMAASCIPVVFDPVEINNILYIDGGILNNLPAEPLIGNCDVILGIHCNPVLKSFKAASMKNVLERSFLLSINANAYQRKMHCDLFIEPPDMAQFGVFDLNRAKEIFNIGYEYIMQVARSDVETLTGLNPQTETKH